MNFDLISPLPLELYLLSEQRRNDQREVTRSGGKCRTDRVAAKSSRIRYTSKQNKLGKDIH